MGGEEVNHVEEILVVNLKLWVTFCDVDMGPLAKVRPENGSGFVLTPKNG